MCHSSLRPVRESNTGFTFLELVWALALLTLLTAIALPAFGGMHSLSLDRSADLAQGQLARARLAALGRREVVSLRQGPPGTLRLLDSNGAELDRAELAGRGFLRLDSLRIRPATIRFNPRGQGSPGSISLYRAGRGVRLISNFSGRVRRHAFRY